MMMMDTLKKQAYVCEPYALSDEVRVHPSLECINSQCQEVAFDPNTQNPAQNMADTTYVSMWMRVVHCCCVFIYF